jgi:hypothetical protein
MWRIFLCGLAAAIGLYALAAAGALLAVRTRARRMAAEMEETAA